MLPRPQPLSLKRLRQALQPGDRLVELVRYHVASFTPAKPTKKQPQRYAAFVLGQTGDVALLDLGPAQAIDTAAKRYLLGIKRSVGLAHRRSVGFAAKYLGRLRQVLYRLTFGRLATLLRGARRVFISPDGTLGLVPLDRLVQDVALAQGKPMLSVQLNTGRDLLELAAHRRPSQKAGRTLVAALVAPQYGASKHRAAFRSLKWGSGDTQRL